MILRVTCATTGVRPMIPKEKVMLIIETGGETGKWIDENSQGYDGSCRIFISGTPDKEHEFFDTIETYDELYGQLMSIGPGIMSGKGSFLL